MKFNEQFPVEPIRSEKDKGSGEAARRSPRTQLAYLFHAKDKLEEEIHKKVAQVLQSEYAGASNEVKESILRINEKLR